MSGYSFYDLSMESTKHSMSQADENILARQRRFREQPRKMLFDPLHGIQPPTYDQVFSSDNKSLKSSRRDVSYRAINKIIAGVKVPKRPVEPDSCCMSGCVNCVWDLFSEDLDFWKTKTLQAVQALEKQGDDVKEQWPLGFDPAPRNLDIKYIPMELRSKKGETQVRYEMPIGLQVLREFEKKKQMEKEKRLLRRRIDKLIERDIKGYTDVYMQQTSK
ncbi:hypothetical protein FOA43_003912 [Brettanomyces nanus]|uniref:Oxidoreductase-like domain-containing protein n=1 Tax=Eeniella nana TaxID=13502 RepID=A0A875S6H1_EENNA|nr:uncharacterized protein FOA43_003912 [Brettanomyces nanus]QPG76523.1 hypothetical protein FOA43_003912 [Brettanomyces nanus]